MSSNELSKQKPKLTIPEQIRNMEKTGITFIDCSENKAEKFLSEHSYYFKIKAYTKCFRKYIDEKHEKFGKYIELDFNQLILFSRIDMKFRQCVLWMTLEIEHALKVYLNKLISENQKEDGYQIIDEFMQDNKKLSKKIKGILNYAKSNPYTCTLVKKYHDDFASWNLVEILTFGELIAFYEFYNKKYGMQDHEKINKLLRYAKFLRNAAAHSNCMLNQFGVNEFRIKPSRDTKKLLRNKIKTISKERCSSSMNIPVLHDFAASVFVFLEFVKSKNAYNRIVLLFDEFLSLIEENQSAFGKELNIISGFNFLKDIIQFFKNKP